MKRAFVIAVIAAACLHAAVGAQQAGLNTPVLPGLPSDPADPMGPFKSDMWQQRQLEADILVSTRNHEHLLTFFNDYRGVNDPNDLGAAGLFSSRGLKGLFERVLAWVTRKPRPAALHPAAAAAEARVGYSRSYDGGLTWFGGLLGKINGLDGMTDPKTAAAPCGIGYAVFINFTRYGQSQLVVLRVQDTNNKDGGDTWESQGYSIVETAANATNGTFHDLPAIVVDPVRTATADSCAHRVYVSWATFNGADGASKLNLARTTAGDGPSWNPTWDKRFIKTGSTMTNQGVMLSVDPREGSPKAGGGGTLYLGWRTFATPGVPAGVWLTTSRDFGESFAKPVAVNRTPVYFYDQPTIGTDTTNLPEYLALRSNALPTMQVVPNGANSSTVFVAWQERVTFPDCPVSGNIAPGSSCGLPSAGGDPRVVLTRSSDRGATWSDWLGVASQRRAVDFGDRDTTPPPVGFGYLPRYDDTAKKSGGQVMPRFSYGGGQFGLAYYEARGALTAVPGTNGLLAGLDRQFDARFALLDPATGALAGTDQISRYPVKFGATFADGKETEDDIAEVAAGVKKINKRSNVPNSGNGMKPFIGDYIGATPIVQYVYDPGTQLWRWATKPADVPFAGFRTVFTDSRNQKPVTPEDNIQAYQNYSPPSYAPDPNQTCVNEGSRNHDVFHAFVKTEVAVNAIATFKQLSGVVDRAFPITVTNGVNTNKFFRLTFDNNSIASFDQFDPSMDVFDIELLPYSSATRVAYVSSTDPKASVKVFVTEIDGIGGTPVVSGQSGNVTLNLDPTNPTDPGNTNGSVNENHNPLVSNPLVSNPLVSNPLVSNAALNPLVSNPLVSNDALNPLVSNPLVSNSSLEGETVYQITDTTWKVTSGGNVASAVATAVNVANAQQLQGSYVFQLLIHKTSTSAGNIGCAAKNVVQDQIISSIPNPLVSNPLVSNAALNPLVSNPLVSNATFALAAPSDSSSQLHAQQMRVAGMAAPAPGAPQDDTQADFKDDAVFVTLRAYQIVETPTVVFDPVANPPSIVVIPMSVDVVNNVEQGTQPLPGSSFVVTNTNDSGPGSLRQAILDANATTGLDTILFAVTGAGAQTISPASALPTVTDPVIIDGRSQQGFAGTPLIVLDGTTAGTGANGLEIASGNTQIRALSMRNFNGNGILITTNGNNLIEGNYIGTDGNTDFGSNGNGIHVIDSGSNTIGGTTAAARNVISGNNGEGVRMDGALATGNIVQGNYVGTNAAATAAIGNGASGVFVRRAPGNSVTGNVVSGNLGWAGITICGNVEYCGGTDFGTQTSDAAGTIVYGNLVGTDGAGAAPIGNAGYGVSVDGTTGTLLGGEQSGQSNVIAFNGLSSSAPLPGVVVFGTGASGNQIRHNSIHTNGGLGIDLGNATGADGLTYNDPADADAGPNGLQNYPVLTSAVISGGVTTVTGTLSTTPDTDVTIDLYYSNVCDPSGNGEGQTWFGSIQNLQSNTDGNVNILANIGPELPAGVLVTATATTADGTSEFSGCRMVVPPGFVDWPVSENGNGHVYEYVTATAPGTWTAADAAARTRSFRGVAGHLATLLDAQENAVANSLRGADMRAWIGLTDAAVEGTFTWITAEPFTYTNWAPGEPNGLPAEDYVEMYASGQWNDTVDGEGLNQGYIVEYPVNPFALVDSAPPPPLTAGDLISRGFYHPSYPGRLLSRVTLWLSADVTNTYTVQLTARANTYDGPLLGTTSVTLTLVGDRFSMTPVNFDFPSPLVIAPGTPVTFAMTQTAPAGTLSVYYHVGACDFSNTCVTPSPFTETEGTNPPLDTFRRNGVSAQLFDTVLRIVLF